MTTDPREDAATAASRLGASRRSDQHDDGFDLVSTAGATVVHPERLDARSRARAMAPSALTLANMFCGFSSIRAAESGQFDLAAIFIGVAILFDIADGATARAVGAITPFGLQFDSLADLISFGVAPAILLWTWGLDDFGLAGWALACFWLGCAAYRLGRFNVTIDPLADKRYFLGLPSPGAAGVVLASVFAFDGTFDGWHRWGPVVLTIVPAALMATSFRFVSFRWLVSPRPDKVWVTVLVVVALVVGFATMPAATGLAVAYGYVALCPIGWATTPIRRRLFGDDAVAPPRHRTASVFFPTPQG